MKSVEVDEYIEGFDGDTRARLQTMRNSVWEVAPEAEEMMAYGMPAYKLEGKPLVYYAAFPKHIGFYATPNGHAAFKDEFKSYKQGKGSVQFPHDKPLPEELIKRVIAFRKQSISGANPSN